MSQLQNFREALALYRRHAWRPVRALMRDATLAELRRESPGAEGEADAAAVFEGVRAEESVVDALWFTRASAGGREAWELRLVAEPPYALFELFEPDEAEEDREDVRREMEARLREYVAPTPES
ncbi:MAG TPA: hypothetical protein VF240_19265 [Pyrinomonadaceae bacterium]